MNDSIYLMKNLLFGWTVGVSQMDAVLGARRSPIRRRTYSTAENGTFPKQQRNAPSAEVLFKMNLSFGPVGFRLEQRIFFQFWI